MTLDEGGIEGRHMMYLHSHTSGSTIKEYTTKVPEKKKCQMYSLLSENLEVPAPKVFKANESKNQQTSTISIPHKNPKVAPAPIQVLQIV